MVTVPRFFNKLQLLSGGIAAMFTNTTTVESELSIIGAEKNVYRQYLTDFSLKGILHAKQLDNICSMPTK